MPFSSQRERLDVGASLSLLAQLTEGLSAGQLLAFTQQLAERVQSGGGAGHAAAHATGPSLALSEAAGQGPPAPTQQRSQLVEVALELLPSFPPLKAEEAQALQEWTARAHSALPPEVGRVPRCFVCWTRMPFLCLWRSHRANAPWECMV